MAVLLFPKAFAPKPKLTALEPVEEAFLPIAIALSPVAPLLSSLVSPVELTEKYLILYLGFIFKSQTVLFGSVVSGLMVISPSLEVTL